MEFTIIDFHCHIESANKAKSILKIMDKHGIEKTVLCAGSRFIAFYNKKGNKILEKTVKLHPDRLAGFASVTPWAGGKGVDELKRAFDSGLKGFKINSYLQGFRLSDDIIDPFIEICNQYGYPVYCHTGTPVTSMPFQLTCLARRHPKVTFIEGHMGWSDFWYDCIESARMADNIIMETSYMIGLTVQEAIKQIGADRIIFGTDYPDANHLVEINKIQRMQVLDEEKRKVLYENARRILK